MKLARCVNFINFFQHNFSLKLHKLSQNLRQYANSGIIKLKKLYEIDHRCPFIKLFWHILHPLWCNPSQISRQNADSNSLVVA
jgi:hypothetical protein